MQVLVWSDEALTSVAENHLDVPPRIERFVKMLERKGWSPTLYLERNHPRPWYEVRVNWCKAHFDASGNATAFYVPHTKRDGLLEVQRGSWLKRVDRGGTAKGTSV